ARNRLLRRVHDVLDHAGGAAEDAGRQSLRAGRRLRGREPRARIREPPSGDGVRASDEDGRMSPLVWVGVAGLGAGGAILRFVVDELVARRTRREFPFGTLLVNVSGAMVLGFLVGLGVGGDQFLLEGTATLGSYTTFSTWMFETQRLVEEGQFGGAVGNVVINLAVGLGATALGRLIGGHL